MMGSFYAAYLLLAEGGGLAERYPWLPKWVNLILFLALLYWLLNKPLVAFFNARAESIKADLERAKRERAAAEAKLAEVNARLAHLDEEGARIRAEADAEAEAEHKRVIARAQEEVEKIAEAAEREIGGALKTARADLQRFVAEKAVELAEANIRAEMTDEDSARLLTEYAEQLQGVNK